MKPVIASCLCLGLLVALPAAAQAPAGPPATNSGGNVMLVNQVTQLRAELQALRGQIEELQRAQKQQAERSRVQYLDLDSRLIRLEGGASPLPAPPPETATDTPVDTAAAPPAIYGDPGALAKGRDEKSAYLAAFDVLKAGNYAGSARAFQDFLQRYPGGSYAPNALYWLGESYYVTQNYALAQQQFQTLLDRYPTHDKAAGALLKVGLSQYGQDQFDVAAATLDAVVQRFPGSAVARTAQDRLRAMRLTAGTP